jgi:hypothetical protein
MFDELLFLLQEGLPLDYMAELPVLPQFPALRALQVVQAVQVFG